LHLEESPHRNGRDHFGAEGATTQETLRQKDRYRNNSGKQAVSLTEGLNLSGTQTDGARKELLWKYKKQLYIIIIKT